METKNNKKRNIAIASGVSAAVVALTLGLTIPLAFKPAPRPTSENFEYILIQSKVQSSSTQGGIYNAEELKNAPSDTDIDDYAEYLVEPKEKNSLASLLPWYEDGELVGVVVPTPDQDWDDPNGYITIDYFDENRTDEILYYDFNENHHEFILTENKTLYTLDSLNKTQMGNRDDASTNISQDLFTMQNVAGESYSINLLEIMGYDTSSQEALNDEFKTDEFQYVDDNGELVEETLMFTDQTDAIHSNSFDFDDEGNLYISLRSFDALLSINVNDMENPELNWILSNPFTYNFTNNDEDISPLQPISGSGTSIKYDSNPLYTPQIKDEWDGKTMDYVSEDGTKYSSGVVDGDSTTDITKWSELDQSEFFNGQHTVRYINNWIENAGGEDFLEGYDPDKIYLSIYDNHILINDPMLYHYKEYLGDKYNYLDTKSYVKILEIDEETMTYEYVLNEEVLESTIKSSALFISHEDTHYLAVSNSTPINDAPSIQVFTFDSISDDQLQNKELVYEVQFSKFDGGGMGFYRAFPIPQYIEGYEYAWNAFSVEL